MAQGQNTFHLVNGDSLTTARYYPRGDSIAFQEGKLGLNEILYMRTSKGLYVFKLPNGPARQVRIYNFGSPCAMGRLQAERYEHVDRNEQRAFMYALAALDDTTTVSCYKKALFALGHDLERKDRPGLDQGIEALTVSRNMIILRTGDTLYTEGNVYMLGDQLVYLNAIDRVHKDDVLVALTKNGQFFIDRKSIYKVLDPPVSDLTPCSIGLIYASMYYGTDTKWNDIPNLGRMKDDQEAKACFLAELVRIGFLR
jgi:hypothetical protein